MKNILAFSLFFFTGLCFAAGPQSAKEKDIERLMNLTKMDAIIDQAYAQIEIMMQNMGAELGVKPSEQMLFDQYSSEVTQVMRDDFSWVTVKPFYIKLYAENFNEAQIRDMLAFYETDTGKATIEKMPTIMSQSMQFSQQEMMKIMPKIKALSEQLKKDLHAHRAGN